MNPPAPQTNALFAINASLVAIVAVLGLGFLKDFFGLATWAYVTLLLTVINSDIGGTQLRSRPGRSRRGSMSISTAICGINGCNWRSLDQDGRAGARYCGLPATPPVRSQATPALRCKASAVPVPRSLRARYLRDPSPAANAARTRRYRPTRAPISTRPFLSV